MTVAPACHESRVGAADPGEVRTASTGELPGYAVRQRASQLDTNGRSSNVRDGHQQELLVHIHALRRYAAALVGNHADADDLVQETLKRALTYIDADRRIDDLRAYLFTVLHNVRVDVVRKRARAGVEVPVDEAHLVSKSSPQSDRFACHEVIEAMQRLSEEHRQVLLLVGVEGMSYRETADILDLPIGTVMSRLNRARTALRQLLGLDGEVELGGSS